MRFASLGSGSQGNALIVEAGKTRILLDCGFSARATVQRLARLDVSPETINAIVLTHEHGDHVSGAFNFARRFGIDVYLTHGTQVAALRDKPAPPVCRQIDSHTVFSIGDLEITPFPVPHDAREPVQYVFANGQFRLGVLTDAGAITPHIVDRLRVCDALVLECNHDPDLLAASAYPMSVKRRISGDYGHLANAQAAALLRQVQTRQLQHIVAAHLSEQNNRPELVVTELAAALNCNEDWIGVATQEEGIGWRQIT